MRGTFDVIATQLHMTDTFYVVRGLHDLICNNLTHQTRAPILRRLVCVKVVPSIIQKIFLDEV